MASQPGPWDDYRPSAPRIVVPTQAPPRNPDQARVDRGNAEAAPYEAPRVQSTIRNNETNTEHTRQTITQNDTRGTNYTDERSMRSAFEGLPDVRNYHTVLPVAQAARSAASGGAGDLDLIYGFARVMDPGSVVRESETEMAQNTGGVSDRVRGLLQSVSNGQHLTPQVRQRLLTEIDNRVSQYRAAYTQIRKNYFRNAERYGFDTDAAVGPDIGEAYQPGPNAPAPAATPEGDPAMDLLTNTVRQVGTGSPLAALPSVNAPGGITATDPRESAQASQVAGQATEDTSGTAANPQMETGQAKAYNDAWIAAVNSGLDRNGLNQWVSENAPRFFPGRFSPGQPGGQLDDHTWNAIEASRRAGRGLNWLPPPMGVSDIGAANVPGVGEISAEDMQGAVRQNYQDTAANAQGAQDRATFAEAHPYIAGADAFMRQAADTATLGTASRIAGTLSGRGAAYEHGISGQDWRDRPLESLGGTFAGGSRMPYGTTLPRQLGAGAAYGGITDFNQSDGSLTDRLGSSLRGAALGAGTNAILGGVSRAYRAPNADAILEAGERQNVFTPRYMTGRTPLTNISTTAVGALPTGRLPLERSAGRVVNDIAAARNLRAGEMGPVLDEAGAGQRAQAGAREFLGRSADRADALFQRVPIHASTPAELTNTRQALSELTEGLASNPRLSALMEDRRLTAFRDALNGGDLSWGDQRRFRSMIGEMIGQPQVAGEVTSRSSLRRLYGALTDDMRATAESQGPRALTMFNRANQYYRGREARREGVISDILGADGQASPESTFKQINRWAANDFRATGQVFRSLPRDDANAVRATIFGRMGTATKGNQLDSVEQSTFSPRAFATEWNGMSNRAKAILIPDRTWRRNMDDIALLSTEAKRAETLSNPSRSGLAIGGAGMAAGAVTRPVDTALVGLTSYYAGRLLSSREGTRTLLRALRNPEAFSGVLGNGEDDQ